MDHGRLSSWLPWAHSASRWWRPSTPCSVWVRATKRGASLPRRRACRRRPVCTSIFDQRSHLTRKARTRSLRDGKPPRKNSAGDRGEARGDRERRFSFSRDTPSQWSLRVAGGGRHSHEANREVGFRGGGIACGETREQHRRFLRGVVCPAGARNRCYCTGLAIGRFLTRFWASAPSHIT